MARLTPRGAPVSRRFASRCQPAAGDARTAQSHRVLTRCLALTFALASLAACNKPPARDPRLNEVDRFDVNWPLKANTFDAAVSEVEATLGPGLKRADGTIEWTGRADETHCVRIQLKDQGGKLSANSETLLRAHPDFASCVSGK